jgi:hypothetical protein
MLQWTRTQDRGHWAVIRDVTMLWSKKDSVARFDQVDLSDFSAVRN